MEICSVTNTPAYRIRKLRESKDYSQQNMADELGLSLSAYSKIETGKTDPSIGRITAIAKILEVDITYFFGGDGNKMEDSNKSYGFATKSDIEELTRMINTIKQEIVSLKTSLQTSLPKKKKKA
jgi:transcriptional regulator with XRE-family HTH domain